MKLMKVQELWEEENFNEAVSILDELVADKADVPYDAALANQYLAHTNILMDRPAQARKALETALSIDGLPVQLIADLKLFYGQVVLGDEEFELARTMFDDWLATTEAEPDPSQLFSAAYANYMTKQLDTAEDLIVRAFEKKKKPQESWYRLHYQILFDLERYDEAVNILHGMIAKEERCH